MASIISLNIPGYRGEPVPNTFMRQEFPTQHLAMIFPGYAYGARMPLLYYPGRLLAFRGADVLHVEYAYHQRLDYQSLSTEKRGRWFAADVEAASQAGLSKRPYNRITLVGKSIGTRAMGHLLQSDQRLQRADCVWLTPLLRDVRLREQITERKPRSLFVIGTADKHYERSILTEVEQATEGESLVVEGANHSLEIPRDILGSLHALEKVIGALDRFLA
jgi:hypothetical protein